MKIPYFIALSIVVASGHAAFAQSVQNGKPLPTISATAASGLWLQRAAFDRNSYGAVRGVSPGTSPEPKLVIYTSSLSKEFFDIAVAFDKYLAFHPELEWSFVQVKDQKGAQAGGYTADELAARLDQIKHQVAAHGIKHLSFLLSAAGSDSAEPDKNIILAHVGPAGQGFPIVDWETELPVDLLKGQMLTNYVESLGHSIQVKYQPVPPIFTVVRLKPGESSVLELALPVGNFRNGRTTGRDFLDVRPADQTVGGKLTSVGKSASAVPGLPDIDLLWEADRDVARLGRKTRLPEKQRAILWQIFEHLIDALQTGAVITRAFACTRLAERIAETGNAPFDFVVVDEAQDLSVAQLRLLAAMGASRPNGLFFAGDLGQRIFQLPFSWKSLGVDVRGRARTLAVNYRTSHQIRMQADRLLEPAVTDVDGNCEERQGTVSVFNGPAPTVKTFESEDAETDAVARWLVELHGNGVLPHEIGIIVRSEGQISRAVAAAKAAGITARELDGNAEAPSGYAAISTMHLAKGLEFRAVAVIACDDEVIPLQERIESVTDDSDLEEVYNTERHLLYVACTRARDYLLVTAVEPGSEFLADLGL